MTIEAAAQSNATLEKVLSRVTEIAVLPQVVFKIVEMTGSEDSSAQEMERAILTDPGFAAKVLATANSAFYNLPRKVSSIREAVMFLGSRQLRILAMNVGVFDLFVGKNDAESLRRRGWWRHSLDSAVCSKWIAEKTRKASPDEAYTCGLLHYMGKTMLDRYAPEKFEEVAKLIESGLSDCEAETAIYGCNHTEVCVGVAGKWGFPEVLLQSLDYLSDPVETDTKDALRASVAMGDRLAFLAMKGNTLEADMALPSWAMLALSISPDQCSEIMESGVGYLASNGCHGI